jgi:hydantoinase/carbamoylase family amidase
VSLSTHSLGVDVMRRLDRLAEHTATPGELTRLYLTPEHKAAVAEVRGWMEAAGMGTRLDAACTLVGRYEGDRPDLPALLLGSHIDTVRNAGKYDGNFGVVAAIEAVAELQRSGTKLPFAIEVLAFGDEEGVRFPMTLTGSKAVAGIFDRRALAGTDANGTTLRDALIAFGGDPDSITGMVRPRDRVLGYVELHIEQGPVLEAEDLPVGIVTAINGATRATIGVKGWAGHAGTVPMSLRRDALTAAAEMILGVERRCAAERNLVGTVGMIEALPGAVNVIPGEVRFTIDIRSPSDEQRKAAVNDIFELTDGIGARRALGVTHAVSYDVPAATCGDGLIEQLEAAVARAGVRPRRLPSGAGHDGLAMVNLCPIAMLFVRCRAGISHNPAESITATDADVAVAVLVDFLRHFQPSPSREQS